MNNKPGLTAVLESLDNLVVISLALRSTNVKAKTLVLEVFAALCLIPGGHPSVLEAMDQLMEALGYGYRFDVVVKCLVLEYTQGLHTSQQQIDELQTAAMAFIAVASICKNKQSMASHTLRAIFKK